MECPSCNRENREDAKFCSECGIKFEEILKCEGCEAELASDDRFCSACGKSVKDAAEPEPEVPTIATEQPTIESEKEPSDDEPIEVEPESEPEPTPKNLSLSEKIASDKREADERIERNRLSRQKTMPVNQENQPQVKVKINNQNGFKSIETLKRMVLASLAITVLLAVLNIIFTFLELNLWQEFKSGIPPTHSEWDASDSRVIFTAYAMGLSWVACVITFLMWIHRASSNLKFLGNPTQRFSPGWAVGWWFVPIMFYIRPYQVIKEIYESSDPKNSSSAILGWYWAFWVINNILTWVSTRSNLRAQSVDEFILADQISIVTDIVMIFAAILVWKIILNISYNQELKASYSENP